MVFNCLCGALQLAYFMSEYAGVRAGKLRLKGAAGASFAAKKKKLKRKSKREDESEGLRHGAYGKTERVMEK